MRRIGLVAALALLLSFAADAHAQTVSVTFSTEAAGTCAVGYADKCPSGNCECQVYTGKVSGGPVGRGTATLSITLDDGYAIPSSPTGGFCVPIFGDLALTGLKDVEDDSLFGTFCDQTNQNLAQPIMGGYGIDSSNAGQAGHNGTFSGKYTHRTGVIRITLRHLE